MTVHRAPCCLAIALLVWLGSPPETAGQDTLARAKDLYVLANYDEALVVLARLHETVSASESSEVAEYQVLCLLALGRKGEALKAIETLVKADPMYRPSPSTVSPRTRATFDALRRELLPGIVQDLYDKAKAAFDRKDLAVAVSEFDRVLTLIDEPGIVDLQNMADLRRLASGFQDLSKAAAEVATVSPAASAAKELSSSAAAPPAPRPAVPPIYSGGDQGVAPPTTVSRPMPPWVPRNDLEKRREFRGVLELVIDETGGVTSVALAKSAHPAYDRQLLEAARMWRFRPATKDGLPVRFRMMIEVVLGPDKR
jgi:TonB family protein